MRAAEDAGWHGAWLADHYMPDTGDATPARGDTYECWALLPALAAVTERIRIGTLVSPTSVHHPALLAKRAATIDRLSGGRMVLGLGAGWQVNEHHAYGVELEPPGRRVSRFEEAIAIIRSMLTQESTTLPGRETPAPGRAVVAGSAAELADTFGQYAELGFDDFIVPDWNLGRDESERADKLAAIKAEVIDRLPGTPDAAAPALIAAGRPGHRPAPASPAA